MARVVITGANRGIGLALVRRYLDKGDDVIGLCRSPDKADVLNTLAAQSNGKLTVGAIDVGDQASVDAAAAAVEGPVDILINNAGIMGGEDQSLYGVDPQEWLNAFDVMVIGPFRVSRAFIPHLAQAKGRILSVSSQVGASTWPMGGFYSYASAKAAGNRVMSAMALDLKEHGILTGSVHPGWVKTDMGGEQADITPEESAAGIHDVIANLTPETSGGFFKWSGEPHPL